VSLYSILWRKLLERRAEVLRRMKEWRYVIDHRYCRWYVIYTVDSKALQYRALWTIERIECPTFQFPSYNWQLLLSICTLFCLICFVFCPACNWKYHSAEQACFIIRLRSGLKHGIVSLKVGVWSEVGEGRVVKKCIRHLKCIAEGVLRMEARVVRGGGGKGKGNVCYSVGLLPVNDTYDV